MRTVGAALLATTMIVSSAFAATDTVGPLTPGKPAGVQKAQMEDSTLLWIVGAGLVIGGIVLVASGSGNSSTPTGSSSSSSSSP